MEVFLLVYLFITLMISIVVFCLYTPTDYYLCPISIYEDSELNIFGALLVFIFLLMIIPFYYVAIFIYWICHVGRK